MLSYFIVLSFLIAGASVFSTQLEQQNKIHCNTAKDEWKCCASTHPVEEFSLTSCIDLKLWTRDWGMEMKVTFNNFTYFHGHIPGSSPPISCHSVRYFLDTVGICFIFYNLKVENDELSGCVAINGHLINRTYKHIELDCFVFHKRPVWAKARGK